MHHDPLKDLIYDSFGIIDEDMIEQMSNVFDQDRPYQSANDHRLLPSRRLVETNRSVDTWTITKVHKA